MITRMIYRHLILDTKRTHTHTKKTKYFSWILWIYSKRTACVAKTWSNQMSFVLLFLWLLYCNWCCSHCFLLTLLLFLFLLPPLVVLRSLVTDSECSETWRTMSIWQMASVISRFQSAFRCSSPVLQESHEAFTFMTSFNIDHVANQFGTATTIKSHFPMAHESPSTSPIVLVGQ